jgi:hypothetical protein
MRLYHARLLRIEYRLKRRQDLGPRSISTSRRASKAFKAFPSHESASRAFVCLLLVSKRASATTFDSLGNDGYRALSSGLMPKAPRSASLREPDCTLAREYFSDMVRGGKPTIAMPQGCDGRTLDNE